jgi:NADH:ubiquinone oxidoreductase subunit 2 (subunit N)
VSLFYYFKIARALFLRGEPEVVPGIASHGPLPAIAFATLIALAGATLWFGLMWDGLIGWVETALA